MSYILDALERSERERQQQDVPSFRQDQALLHMGGHKRSPILIGLVLILSLVVLVLAALLIYPRVVDTGADTASQVIKDNNAEKYVTAASSTVNSTAVVKKDVGTVYPSTKSVNPSTQQTSARLVSLEAVNDRAAQTFSPADSVVRSVASKNPLAFNSTAPNPVRSNPEQNDPETTQAEHIGANTDGLSKQSSAKPELIRPKMTAETEPSPVKVVSKTAISNDDATEAFSPEKLSPRVRIAEQPLNDVGLEQTDSQTVTLTPSYHELAFLHELDPSTRPRVPKLVFNSHIYSSEPTARRVMINNIYLREGQSFEGMRLLGINEDFIVFEKNGKRFKIAAMRDWLGSLSPRFTGKVLTA